MDHLKLLFISLFIAGITNSAFSVEFNHTLIRQRLQDAMRCRKMPGLSVVVVNNGSVVMAEAFGKRQLFLSENDTKATATANTKFCIGSLSKAFTATILAKIIEENEK